MNKEVEPGYREPSKDPKDLKIQELQETLDWHEANEKAMDARIDDLRGRNRELENGDNRSGIKFCIGLVAGLILIAMLITWSYFQSVAEFVDNNAVCETVCESFDLQVAHCHDFRVTCAGNGVVRTFAH